MLSLVAAVCNVADPLLTTGMRVFTMIPDNETENYHRVFRSLDST